MRRTSHLICAAGLAGAVLAGVLTHASSVPALASSEWSGAEATVGTVDVLAILERMLETEPYASSREATTKVWNDQIQPLSDELEGLNQSIPQMDPNDPRAQELFQQYQSLQQRIGRLRQDASRALDSLSAEQLADAYKKIHAAVQTVAQAQGCDRVFSSRMTVDDVNAENTNVIVQEVLLRPVLRNVPENDLTPLVVAELGLPEEAPEPAEGPAPAPGEDPVGPGGEGAGGGGE